MVERVFGLRVDQDGRRQREKAGYSCHGAASKSAQEPNGKNEQPDQRSDTPFNRPEQGFIVRVIECVESANDIARGGCLLGVLVPPGRFKTAVASP